MATQTTIDPYVLSDLNRELKHPAGVVLYLYLWSMKDIAAPLFLSHQHLANATGLSKSTVQKASQFLRKQELVEVVQISPTSPPGYRLKTPWRREKEPKTSAVKKKKAQTPLKKNTGPQGPLPVSRKKQSQSKVDPRSQKYLDRIKHKNEVFQQKLSHKEQADWISDYRKRCGYGNTIDDETARRQAIDQWFRLLPKD